MTSEELDNLFRNEVNGLEGLPPQVNWKKERGWQKLNAQLEHKAHNRGIIPFLKLSKNASSWTYGVAATLALTLLSIVGVNHWVIQQNGSIAMVPYDVNETSSQEIREQQTPEIPLIEKGLNYQKNINPKDLNHSIASTLIADEEHLMEEIFMANFASFNTNDYNKTNVQKDGNVFLNTIPGLEANIYLNPNTTNFAIPNHGFLGPIIKQEETPKNLSFMLNGSLAANTSNFNLGIEGDLVFQFKGKKNEVEQNIALGIRNEFQYVHNPKYGVSDSGLDGQINADFNGKKKSGVGMATFVTASYSRNIAKPNKKPFYLGLKAGYSIVNESKSFDDNALSLELIIGGNETSKFKVSPVVYLTDDMKNVVPGIKLGMSLGKYEKDISI